MADDGVVGLDFARAVGPGGRRVSHLLDRITSRSSPPADFDLARLVRTTPAGWLGLPVDVVPMAAGLEAAEAVDPAWLATVERRRAAAGRAVVSDGRKSQLDAALNVAMLLATERLLVDREDLGAKVASGAQLWLLGGAVASALGRAVGDDPFWAWGEVLASGAWPIGPARGRLVVALAAVAVAHGWPGASAAP